MVKSIGNLSHSRVQNQLITLPVFICFKMFLICLLSSIIFCVSISQEISDSNPPEPVLRNINSLNNRDGSNIGVVGFSLYLPRIKSDVSLLHKRINRSSTVPFFETGLLPNKIKPTVKTTFYNDEKLTTQRSSPVRRKRIGLTATSREAVPYLLPTPPGNPTFETPNSSQNRGNVQQFEPVHLIPITSPTRGTFLKNITSRSNRERTPKNSRYYSDKYPDRSSKTGQEKSKKNQTKRREAIVNRKRQSLESKLVKDEPYFQDIFVHKKSPEDIEFGHIMENLSGWEERFERRNMKDERHQGKIH